MIASGAVRFALPLVISCIAGVLLAATSSGVVRSLAGDTHPEQSTATTLPTVAPTATAVEVPTGVVTQLPSVPPQPTSTELVITATFPPTVTVGPSPSGTTPTPSATPDGSATPKPHVRVGLVAAAEASSVEGIAQRLALEVSEFSTESGLTAMSAVTMSVGEGGTSYRDWLIEETARCTPGAAGGCFSDLPFTADAWVIAVSYNDVAILSDPMDLARLEVLTQLVDEPEHMISSTDFLEDAWDSDMVNGDLMAVPWYRIWCEAIYRSLAVIADGDTVSAMNLVRFLTGPDSQLRNYVNQPQLGYPTRKALYESPQVPVCREPERHWLDPSRVPEVVAIGKMGSAALIGQLEREHFRIDGRAPQLNYAESVALIREGRIEFTLVPVARSVSSATLWDRMDQGGIVAGGLFAPRYPVVHLPLLLQGDYTLVDNVPPMPLLRLLTGFGQHYRDSSDVEQTYGLPHDMTGLTSHLVVWRLGGQSRSRVETVMLADDNTESIVRPVDYTRLPGGAAEPYVVIGSRCWRLDGLRLCIG